MRTRSTSRPAFRWLLLLALVASLGLAVSVRPTRADDPDDELDWLLYPASGTFQVGSQLVVQLFADPPGAVRPEGITDPVTFTFAVPQGLEFVSAQGGPVPMDCGPAVADHVTCRFHLPANFNTGVMTSLTFKFTEDALPVYGPEDLDLLATPQSGMWDSEGDEVTTPYPVEIGAQYMLLMAGQDPTWDIETTPDREAVEEGGVVNVGVTFTTRNVPPVSNPGPVTPVQPIEAVITNGEIVPGSITCPGAGTAEIDANIARCSGGTLPLAEDATATMTFKVRAKTAQDAQDIDIYLRAPSFALTDEVSKANPLGTTRARVTVRKLGLATPFGDPPWQLNQPIAVCTAHVPVGQEGDSAAGIAQSSFPVLDASAFEVRGPGGDLLPGTTYLDSAADNCGYGQSGVEFTPAEPGSYTVTAFYNGDGVNPGTRGSSTLALTVAAENPAPSLNALQPAETFAGEPSFVLTVTGTNFVNGAVVRWNGQDRTTEFVNDTTLRALIPADLLMEPGTATITVYNPGPGGGKSNGVTFQVRERLNPLPVITALDPSTVDAGIPGFTLVINGTGFIPASEVLIGGVVRPALYVSATELRVNLETGELANPGTLYVAVRNPEPGGGTSLAKPFTITGSAPAPVLTGISPNSAPAGSSDLTLTVTGSNFASNSIVRWNGQDLATTYVSATQLTAVVPAAKLAAAGTAQVTVFTPGGGASSPQEFTITSGAGVPTEELGAIVPGSVVSRSRLAFTATTGDLNLTAVSFVIRRDDGKYWNGEAGAWQTDAFENPGTKSGDHWEYAVTGAARRQFVNTTVEVEVRGAGGGQQYVSATTAEIHIR